MGFYSFADPGGTKGQVDPDHSAGKISTYVQSHTYTHTYAQVATHLSTLEGRKAELAKIALQKRNQPVSCHSAGEISTQITTLQ